MDSYLLSTKVRVPPRSSHTIPRDHLSSALESDIRGHNLVLLSAPAGYGKTTLLSQWARSSRVPVGWYSIDKNDNDFDRFFRYLLFAWECIQPEVRESDLGLLLSGNQPDHEAVLTAFINGASELPDDAALVLDDYHLIEEPAIQKALTFLLDHLPPPLHLILSVRSDPPLPFARYRARHQLREYRAEDLRFDLEETDAYLNTVLDRSIDQDQIATLHAQLEGWPAGVQLAALSLQRTSGDSNRVTISGRNRYIADYLTDDVFSGLSADTQRFLLQCSILDRLNESLCNAVAGRTDSREMLVTLERQNLFLQPLDDDREWFRFHRVFADFLYSELQRTYPDAYEELHRRAARWYLAHALPDPAFEHAVRGNDVDLTAEICDLYANAKLLGGDFKTVNHWLTVLPERWYSIYPVLGLARAGLLAFSGDINGCIQCIDDIERQLAARAPEESRWQLARIHTVRCFVACMHNDVPRAEELADLALRDLAEDNLGFRPGIYAALGDVYRQNGRWADAYESYRKVLDFSDAPAARVQAAHVYGALADLSLRQGRLRDAERYWQEALKSLNETDGLARLPLPVIGWIYIRLAEILYEWNRLDEAREYVAAGIQRAELGGDVRALIAGYLVSGRLKLAQGETDEAREYLERARPLVEQAQFHEWITRFERFQLEVWLSENRLRAVVEWTDQIMQNEMFSERPERVIAEIALARALTLKGDPVSIREASTLLDRLLPSADSEGRISLFIEGLALRALGESRLGDQAAAMTSLEHSLRLAEPEGYMRVFVDMGLPLARLLQSARARSIRVDYVETLLLAFGTELGQLDDQAPALPEPLTGREQEILTLLAAGLTNIEIANRLFISPETVKKHTGNIYSKLAVRSRLEAVARARTLDLLK